MKLSVSLDLHHFSGRLQQQHPNIIYFNKSFFSSLKTEFCGPLCAQYQHIFLQPLLEYIKDKSPEVRQAATYGVGVLAQVSSPPFKQNKKLSSNEILIFPTLFPGAFPFSLPASNLLSHALNAFQS